MKITRIKIEKISDIWAEKIMNKMCRKYKTVFYEEKNTETHKEKFYDTTTMKLKYLLKKRS